MRATKGRASYLGERSIGHQDPGATSTGCMLHMNRSKKPAGRSVRSGPMSAS